MAGLFGRISAAALSLMMILGQGALFEVHAAPSAEKRLVPVYRKSLDEKETAECLFFSDMPNVPYMSMELYYNKFLDGTMTVSPLGGGKYLYSESQCGDTATVDINSDTFTSGDMASFIACPVYKIENCKFVLSGPDTFYRVSGVSYDRPASEMTLDLGKYGIDVREKDGTVYYPFCTLSDIFGNVDYIASFYADGRIFFTAYYDDVNGGQAYLEDPVYFSSIKTGTRPKDVIEMTYKELQLSFDYFYGYPADRNGFALEMKMSGLDKALTAYDSRTKELLLSEKSGDYFAGMDRLLNYLLCDGGHTGMGVDEALKSAITAEGVLQDYINGVDDVNRLRTEYNDKFDSIVVSQNTLLSLRESILGSGNYFSKGNTALICFNKFEVDYQGWRDYFAGRGAMPSDSVGIVYSGLQRARSEGIKNLVIDLSANIGGDSIAMHGIIGILLKDYSYSTQNLLGDQTLTQSDSTDRNLDGTLDEKDEAVSYSDMNIAVLTSRASFSCGTLFPLVMSDNGIMILGEQSGGGSCAVLLRATADGVLYNMSSYSRFVGKNGQPQDDGVPVDVELTALSLSGETDYSAFYDLDRLGREIETFYAAKKPSEPSQQSTVVSIPSESSSAVSQASAVSVPSEAEQSSQPDGGDQGWIGTIVLVFAIFGIASAGLIVFGIVMIRRK